MVFSFEISNQPCLGWKKNQTLCCHTSLGSQYTFTIPRPSIQLWLDSFRKKHRNMENSTTLTDMKIVKHWKYTEKHGNNGNTRQPCDDSAWQRDRQPKHHSFCWWERLRMPHWTLDPVRQALVWRRNNLKKELDLQKIRKDFASRLLSNH